MGKKEPNPKPKPPTTPSVLAFIEKFNKIGTPKGTTHPDAPTPNKPTPQVPIKPKQTKLEKLNQQETQETTRASYTRTSTSNNVSKQQETTRTNKKATPKRTTNNKTKLENNKDKTTQLITTFLTRKLEPTTKTEKEQENEEPEVPIRSLEPETNKKKEPEIMERKEPEEGKINKGTSREAENTKKRKMNEEPPLKIHATGTRPRRGTKPKILKLEDGISPLKEFLASKAKARQDLKFPNLTNEPKLFRTAAAISDHEEREEDYKIENGEGFSVTQTSGKL